MLTDTGTEVYLGPATVLDIAGDRIELQLPHGKVWARQALIHPYEPAPGDAVLAIGAEEVYVIGILLGHGKTRFKAPGDLELAADGAVNIVAAKAIQLSSPEVRVRADRLETIARTSFEKLVNCYRWVKDVIQTRSGRMRTLVEGHYTVAAERVVERAKKDVKIDGRKIHLG